MKLKDFISSNELLLIAIGIIILFPFFSNAQVGEAAVNRQTLMSALNNPTSDSRISSLNVSDMRKLYSRIGYEPIWLDIDTQRLKPIVKELRTELLIAYTQGFPAVIETRAESGEKTLVSWTYWDKNLNDMAANKQKLEPLFFELLATNALLKYSQHMLSGRFDARSVDSNIKMAPRAITDNTFSHLVKAVTEGEGRLRFRLRQFAPPHPSYVGLKALLLNLYKHQLYLGNWKSIPQPGVDLFFVPSQPMRNEIIPEVRKRLAFFGYTTQNVNSDVFDSDLDKALRNFQEENNLKLDGMIGGKVSKVLKYLNVSTDQRIQQVKINMERLRWLPRTPSTQEIFVNLAMTRFKLFEVAWDERKDEYLYREALAFKTINGKDVRQTPIRIDSISSVKFNPNWTVPASIARADKLPLLQQNSKYLSEHNMYLVKDGRKIDSTGIDWLNFSPEDFQDGRLFSIVQNPGYNNALGVVKFELTGGNAIYMHDTNEREKFSQENRHGSSGCIRLEKPLILAEYLRPRFAETIPPFSEILPSRDEGDSRKSITVRLKKGMQMPVYLIYLTAEQGADGRARFADDPYEQDPKLEQAMNDAVARGSF